MLFFAALYIPFALIDLESNNSLPHVTLQSFFILLVFPKLRLIDHTPHVSIIYITRI